MEPLLIPPLASPPPLTAPLLPPLATVSAPAPAPAPAPVPANPEDLHIAQVATAPPPKHAPSQHNHPPYAEMIVSAIKALNEKTGSSKKAIAKFIDSTYTNLPPTHSALLTRHLKRLKQNGIVLMLKHSYKLPKSSPTPTASAPGAAGAGTASGLKRGRGRPPKPKTSIGPDGSVSVALSVPPKKGRGRPPKSISKPKPKPKLIERAAPGQRPRGRPRKGVLPGSVPTGSISVTGAEFGSLAVMVPIHPQDVTMVSKAGRPVGRPRRINVDSSATVVGGVKVSKAGRPVGRPKRGGVVAKPLGVSTGRPVGRPPKVGVVKPVKPKKVSSGRPVGRPPKVGGARGRPPKVGGARGRPPKDGGAAGASPIVGVEKPVRVSTGRPVGRPRKGEYLKDKAVKLLEESLALGLNQDVSTMLRRETELYHIITGNAYQAITEEGGQVINDKAATQ